MTAARPSPKVVIFGGLGFFGSRVAEDLLERTSCRIVLVGRRAPTSAASHPRAAFERCDLQDRAAVLQTLAGACVVVNCAGRFRSEPAELAQAAVQCGVHYVDLAEDADFIQRVNALDQSARRAGVTLLSGLSVVPGLAVLLTEAARDPLGRVHCVRTFVAPGSRGSRGEATIRTLLAGVGTALRVRRHGQDVRVRGWSEPEWVLFPPPIGWRLQYLAIETPGSDAIVRDLGAQGVEFKAGSEFAWLNRSLAAAAKVREVLGFPRLDTHAAALRRCLALLGAMGTDRGGVCVEIVQEQEGIAASRWIAATAQRQGERIPAMLAGVAAAALASGELSVRGAPPLSAWLAPARLLGELRKRGLRFWRKAGAPSPWEPLDAADNAVT